MARVLVITYCIHDMKSFTTEILEVPKVRQGTRNPWIDSIKASIEAVNAKNQLFNLECVVLLS